MASPSHNNKSENEDDRFSALPDHILVDIMHRLDLRTYLELIVVTELQDHQCDDHDYLLFGQRLRFFGSYPYAFRRLRSLSIQNMTFDEPDLPNLLNSCDQLQRLRVESCDSGRESVLRIDAPRSRLTELVFAFCSYLRIELVRVPKLVYVSYDTWMFESRPVVFVHVPNLRGIDFGCAAMNWQPPFKLSEWLSGTRLENVSLDFQDYMIWIKPEDPKLLQPIFSTLTDLYLSNVFAECDLEWTFHVHNAEKVNVSWEASSGFKHCNLKLLDIGGFEVDCKLMGYIRLVMGCATRLRKVCLHDKEPCDDCDAMNLEAPSGSGFPVDEGDKNLVREHLSDGLSSAVEIIIE